MLDTDFALNNEENAGSTIVISHNILAFLVAMP